MKIYFLLFLTVFYSLACYSQPMKIFAKHGDEIDVTILDSLQLHKIIMYQNGKPNINLRKKWTARTYELRDGKIVVEFFDHRGVLINSRSDFNKLQDVRFTKNTLYFLKKNISYKIEMSYREGEGLIASSHPKQLKQFVSDMPEYFDFEVYKLPNGQILYLDKSRNAKSATIFENLKTLASENENVCLKIYDSEDEEYLMKRLASGDSLPDYDSKEFFIYPKYEADLIKNQKLTLVEKKVFVAPDFYGNLYHSASGTYMLLDDFEQLNTGKTEKIGIGTLRIYPTLAEVEEARKKYEENKDKPVVAEHFYKKISDKYKDHFTDSVSSLIASLPVILNFDKDQLTFDTSGMALIDEALKWHSGGYDLFDTWYPSILAYYGAYIIRNKNPGKWTMSFDKDANVWIPHVILADGSDAFDVLGFYKDMYEGPIPLSWGDAVRATVE